MMKKVLWMVLAGLLLLVAVSVAQAQFTTIYGNGYYNYPVYVNNGYYQQPYYYPTYYPKYEYKEREVLVPVLQPLPFFIDPRISYLHNGGNYIQVPLTTQTPGGVKQATAQPKVEPKAEVEVKQDSEKKVDIDDLINRIEERVKERQKSQQPTEDAPPPVPGFQAKIVPVKTAGGILSRSCYSCHNAKIQKGDVEIFAGPSRFTQALDHAAIIDAIAGGRMPPADSKKPRVTAEELAQIKREWGF